MALTTEQTGRIKNLVADALASKVKGFDAYIDDGTRYALLCGPDGWIVSDGERFWEHPTLVQEFDVHKDFTTERYYLRGVNKCRHYDVLPNDQYSRASGAELPRYFAVTETVIFDHTRQDANGRAVRTVIRHKDGRERSSERSSAK